MFVYCHKDAVIPKRSTSGAAGYDLSSVENVIIPPNSRVLIGTGLKLTHMSSHVYGRIAPRSSLAFRHCVDVCAGVVDSDYRGEIKVLLHNAGNEPYHVHVGDRIAQLIFEHIKHFDICSSAKKIERGSGGFGSTGK